MAQPWRAWRRLIAVEGWEDLVHRGKVSSLAADSFGHCLLAIVREPLIRLQGFL